MGKHTPDPDAQYSRIHLRNQMTVTQSELWLNVTAAQAINKIKSVTDTI